MSEHWKWIARLPACYCPSEELCSCGGFKPDEKLALFTYRANQVGDQWCPLSPKAVAEQMGRSEKQLKRCLKKLVGSGLLGEKIIRTSAGEFILHQVRQLQAEMLFPQTFPQKQATTGTISLARGQLGTDSPRISVTTTGKAKDKSRAELRPHGTQQPANTGQKAERRTEIEQRRIVAARDRRRSAEEEVRREANVGAGPTILRRLERVAVAAVTPMPPARMSDAAIEARRVFLRRQCDELLQKAGNG